MNQYIIIALLPEPIASDLAQLRAELDIWTPQWLPPHVTIVRPFALELPPDALARIQQPLAITAQVMRWATFRNPDNNVLYLEPTQEPFRREYQALFERVPELHAGDTSIDPNRRFADTPTFHITVAAHIPDNVIDRIFSKVSQKTYLQVFQIHQFSLFSQENGSFWEQVTG